MPLTENYRLRHFVRRPNGSVADAGVDLVQYGSHGEMWEPADTVLARGFNGTGKVITGIRIVDEGTSGMLNSNVFYPRTGTDG